MSLNKWTTDPPFRQTSVLGVRVDVVEPHALATYAIETAKNRGRAVISNVNAHAVNLAVQDEDFKRFINTSQVVFCDGFGVKWAGRTLGGHRLHRLAFPDWFTEFAGMCAQQGLSMFFLGARPGVAADAASALCDRIPALRLLGVHDGYFDKSVTSRENRELVKAINSLHPDILIVGLGMPIQEKWISENWPTLEVRVVFTAGATFDYLAHRVKRAPRWMIDNGLEWFGRLLIEPRRLWRRYLLGNVAFVFRVIRQWLWPRTGRV